MKGKTMYLNTSVKYALMAVAYVAKNSKDGNVQALTISKEYNIPLEYLLKLMQQLNRANILKSKRGPHGGFRLARSPEEITLYDVIEAVDGTFGRIDKMTLYTKKTQFVVKMEKVCKDAVAAEKTILQKAKLSQIIK